MAPFPDHVLVIPHWGIGHITPMLALAKRLSASYRISFILSDFYADLIVRRGMLPPASDKSDVPSTTTAAGFDTKPDNFRLIRLESKITEELDLSHEITTMMSLPATMNAELPIRLAATSEHHSWDDVSRTQFGTPEENQASLEKYFDFWPQRPVAVVADYMAMPTFIKSRPSSLDKVPIAAFQPTSASAYAFFLEMYLAYDQSQSMDELEREVMNTISSKSSRKIYEEMQLSAEGINNEAKTFDTISSFSKMGIIQSSTVLPQASVMLIDTFHDLEAEAVDKMNADRGDRPIIQCVGPLCCYEMFVEPRTNNQLSLQPENRRILNWLNEQASRTVVFISLGSLQVLDEAQVIELEQALLTCGHPCLWTLREKTQQMFLTPETRSQRVREEDDFIDCSSGTGRCLIVDWSPQREVLVHPAVGGFLSHCGWNSTLETLSAGVPVVCWPMWAEQHGNAAHLKRLGVAEIVADTRQFGRIVPAEEIRAAIHQLVDSGTFLEKVTAISKSAQAAVSNGGKSQQNWASFPRVLPS